MATVNESLSEAAKAGSEVVLRALLHEPGCNALAKDDRGVTALMGAARRGPEVCVGLRLPVSNTLAKDENGFTASGGSAHRGHESWARFIDEYALAQSEHVALGVAVCVRAPRGRGLRRM